MFDFLKKKISGFLSGVTKDKEEKPKEENQIANSGGQKEEESRTKKEIESEVKIDETELIDNTDFKTEEQKPKHTEKADIKSDKTKDKSQQNSEDPINKSKIEPSKSPSIKKEKTSVIELKKEVKIEKPKEITGDKTKELKVAKEKPKPIEKTKEKEIIKIALTTKIKNLFSGSVEITESDLKNLEDFELELLEADVDLEIAQEIKESIRSKLLKKRIEKNQLHSFVLNTIKETLIEILDNDKKVDFLELANEKKPLKIMFLGVNGAGKTTTIAKVAKYFLNNNKRVVLAAADTFRAAAIEQLEVHARNLGVRLIKREYGSDPTSVAFDAVNYATAHSIDVVLIDTAGRQDTNLSLLNEMKKMSRVITPDLKVYIGESIAGNAIIEQVKAFNREIGIEAVILTKLDCDAKGGTMLSISKATGVPIAYIGIGQKYEDLEKFDAEEMASRIVS